MTHFCTEVKDVIVLIPKRELKHEKYGPGEEKPCNNVQVITI